MVSNHAVMPLMAEIRERKGTEPGDLRRVVLLSRRLSIGGAGAGVSVLRMSGGSGALAAIGLIAFVGVAQILPAMLGALFWRGATRTGALLGLVAGFALGFTRCICRPLAKALSCRPAVFADGPWGLDWLRPRALFGVTGLDPLMHALFWSLASTRWYLLCRVASELSNPAGAVARRAVRQCL
jgi:Na+/proline symporter